tara:strand:- start:2501 stop:4717 length:2217 start_codon:yes stop_codon:yes gene_type:complete
MLEEIRSEINLKRKAELLKEYVRGEVNLEYLSEYLRHEVQNAESKAWKNFCKQIQKYVRQQFYKKNRLALLNSEASRLAESLPIQVGVGDKQKSNPILGFHLLDDKTKLDWLDRAELQHKVLKNLLKSHPEMILLERNPQIFRRLQGILEGNGVAAAWEGRIQERLHLQSEKRESEAAVEEVAQQVHMQQSQVVHHWTRIALMASLACVLYFSVFPGAENTFDRLILTWETYLSNADDSRVSVGGVGIKNTTVKAQELQELSMVKFVDKLKPRGNKINISIERASKKSVSSKVESSSKEMELPLKKQIDNNPKSLKITKPEVVNSASTIKNSSNIDPRSRTLENNRNIDTESTRKNKTVLDLESISERKAILTASKVSSQAVVPLKSNSKAKKPAKSDNLDVVGPPTKISLDTTIDPKQFVINGPVNLNLEAPDELKNLTVDGPVEISLPEASALGNLSFQDSLLASEWSTTGILLLGREKGNRADTVIYAMVHHNPLSLRFLSLPRDTRVPIEYQGKEVNDKIGHALRWGGVESIRGAAEKMLGLKIDHYVTLDLKIFRELVDVVGGVEIHVDRNLRYVDRAGGVNIDLKKGLQLLNGVDAEGYVRFRTDGKGDLGRIKRQQKFLAAFLDRLRNMSELSWENIQLLSGLPKFLSEVVQKSSTDLTLVTVAQLLKSFISNPDVDVEFKRLGGKAQYLSTNSKNQKRSYYISNSKQVMQAVRWLTIKDMNLDQKLAMAN